MVTKARTCCLSSQEKTFDIIAYSSLVPLSTWRHKSYENGLKTDQMYKDSEDADFHLKN